MVLVQSRVGPRPPALRYRSLHRCPLWYTVAPAVSPTTPSYLANDCRDALLGLRVVAPVWVLLSACVSTSGTGHLGYGDRAQAAYVAALTDFYDEDCLLAEPAFGEVRRQYPYSRFAALAELRIADCQFRDAKYPEAIQSYREFIRYRPSHPEVPYAHFRTGLAHFEQIPADWLLSPPSHERDQHFTQESLRLFRRFILDYPEDPLLGRAQEMVQRAVAMLAEHEFYVANFYADLGRPKAVAGRLRTLLRSYPDSGLDAAALLLLGETYLQLSDGRRARAAFEELVDRYPNSEEAGTARDEFL